MTAVLTFLSWLLWMSPAYAAGKTGFVGDEKCRPCHEKEYALWLADPHARAYESLPQERRNELRCLFCHATDAQSDMTGYHLLSVQCEGCHGPGEAHLLSLGQRPGPAPSSTGYRPIPDQRCRECHSGRQVPSLLPFDAGKAREVIRHW
jgi:hypothetical protein